MEQIDYNLLYRWFVGLSPDNSVWDATTFTKNRARLMAGEVFAKFMTTLLNHPEVKPLLSDERFSVDGTLIEAWASHKSFQPKDGDDGVEIATQRLDGEASGRFIEVDYAIPAALVGAKRKVRVRVAPIGPSRAGPMFGARVFRA